MSRPITYSPLSHPGGLTPEEWAKEVRIMKSRGWLQDPQNLDWPDGPDHPDNVARRMQDSVCLRCCWRGECRKARRCLHLINLAMRENRHKIWPDTWKTRVDHADLDEQRPFVPAKLLPRLRIGPFTDDSESE
jgi:hypothetical protein